MNPKQSRLRHEEISDHRAFHKADQSTAEFATVEDLLRQDAGETPVPPEVTERLEKSIASEPKPTRSWLKRLFS